MSSNSPTTKFSVHQMPLYNTSRLKDAEVIAVFAARKPLLDRLLKELDAEKPKSRAQHHLIVGHRGMGKTLLLARIAAELRGENMKARFIPLVFAEEQYSVDRLSKFWLNCLDSLADEMDRLGDEDAVDTIDTKVRQLTSRFSTAGQDKELAREALEAFLETAKSIGRRPVLLVDNLQIVFDRLDKEEKHSLRELLMRPGCPILIGASPSPPADGQDYNAAFYDHLKPHYLRPLEVDEMKNLMLHLADITERPDVRKHIASNPNRLKVLRQLTGGNPRTTVTLFFLYAEDFSPSAFGDLENLLDRVTPLYKARFEELSEQQQVIASAIANHWDPITNRKISENTGLATGQISSQLDRMEKLGFVEKVALFNESSAGFQLAERFFNIWFLMRSASRRQRREVEFLTRFLQCVYEAPEREGLASDLLAERNISPDRYFLSYAVAETLDSNDAKEALKRHAQLDLMRQRDESNRHRLDEILDISNIEAATIKFDELRQNLENLVPESSPVPAEKFARLILGDRLMFVSGDRERLATRKKKLTAKEVTETIEVIQGTRKSDIENYSEPAINWFSSNLVDGQLRNLRDVGDWNRLFRGAKNFRCIQLLLDSLPEGIGKFLSNDAILRVKDFLTPFDSDSASVWYNWGYDLHIKLQRYQEAEMAYRRSLEINPDAAAPMTTLGILLGNNFKRHKEAEAAFLQAIELGPAEASPWNGLGTLFARHMRQYDKAESAFRRAIELAPVDSIPWNNLGNVLSNNNQRFKEAEDAYLKAIELDSTYSYPWIGLGNLLFERLDRNKEAEFAYRRAIQLDEEDSYAWSGLGNLLFEHSKNYEDAENAFRRATQSDRENVSGWIGLGNVLSLNNQKFEEAEAAYLKAIELDPRSEIPKHDLIFLQRDMQNKVVDAHKNLIDLLFSKELNFLDTLYLQQSLFAIYESNWGTAENFLRKALESVDTLTSQIDMDWIRASAVLLHLDYGAALLTFLEERGEQIRLRPWYESLKALHLGDRDYLQNIAPEIRVTAEEFYDQIEKYLNQLPAATRRRPLPEGKKPRKGGRRKQ